MFQKLYGLKEDHNDKINFFEKINFQKLKFIKISE